MKRTRRAPGFLTRAGVLAVALGSSAAADPIETAQLEPGDHLLPWGDEGIAHRYCHFTSEDDTRELLEGLLFEIVDSYAADGREGNLNRYFICRFSNTQVEPKEGEMPG